MAVEIARSLEDIDNKVKQLNKSLKDGQAESKELDKALKLDPKSTETAVKKMQNLQTAVGTATQKVVLLKQKQDEAARAFQRGDISANEFKKIELAVLKAENEVRSLNAELNKTSKANLQQATAGLDKLTSGLNKAQSAAKTLSKIALGIVTALGAAAVSFAVTGSELDSVSKKFKITAEELQTQRNLYQKATGSADNFDSAMTSLNKAMTSIAKGSGKAYAETLDKLGVSTVDSTGKQKALSQVYAEVVAALNKVTDENEQASLSNILFGSSGMYVAEVAALTNGEVAEYNANLYENGLITSENASKATEMANAFNSVKGQLQMAAAEIAVALMPVILELAEIIKTTVIPILQSIAGWFASMSPTQQKFLMFVLMLLIILPKVIAVITAIVGVIKAIGIASYSSAGGLAAVSTAGAPLWAIILAISAAVLALIILFAMLAGKSKDVTKELKAQTAEFEKMEDKYSGMAADMGITTESVSSNSSTKNVNFSVEVNATGDSAANETVADKIADNLADRINAQLGGKI